MAKQKLNYNEAISEIEAILEKIENEEIDVDNLAKEVKRATELISLCKDKLYQTDKEITKILDDMENEGGES